MKIIKRINLALQIFFLIIHLLLFVWFVIIENIRLQYMFCKMGEVMLWTIAFSVILPSALFVVGILFSKMKHHVWSVILQTVCSLLLFLTLGITALWSGFIRGGVSSETNDPDNYGQFDSYVTTTLSAENQSDFLPDKEVLPEKFEYRYMYSYGIFDEVVCIELKATFAEEDFLQETKRLAALQFDSIEGVFYQYRPLSFCIGYQIDESSGTIYYVVTDGLLRSGEALLEKIKTGNQGMVLCLV